MEPNVCTLRSDKYAGMTERWPEALAGARVRCLFIDRSDSDIEYDMVDIVLADGTNYALSRTISQRTNEVGVYTNLQLYDTGDWQPKWVALHTTSHFDVDLETALANAFIEAIELFFVSEPVR